MGYPEPDHLPRPSVLANVSAVGYYGDRGDTPLTERDPPGEDFLARLVVDWEAAARFARALGQMSHRPSLLPVPALALRVALGELAGSLLGNQRGLSARASGARYAFIDPALLPALRDSSRSAR